MLKSQRFLGGPPLDPVWAPLTLNWKVLAPRPPGIPRVSLSLHTFPHQCFLSSFEPGFFSFPNWRLCGWRLLSYNHADTQSPNICLMYNFPLWCLQEKELNEKATFLVHFEIAFFFCFTSFLRLSRWALDIMGFQMMHVGCIYSLRTILFFQKHIVSINRLEQPCCWYDLNLWQIFCISKKKNIYILCLNKSFHICAHWLKEVCWVAPKLHTSSHYVCQDTDSGWYSA